MVLKPQFEPNSFIFSFIPLKLSFISLQPIVPTRPRSSSWPFLAQPTPKK